MSTPSSSIVPDVGSISRLIIRIEVVFPQPDGPTSVVIFPFGAVSVELVDGDGAVGIDLGNVVERDHDCLSGRVDFGRRLSPADRDAAAESSIRPYWAASRCAEPVARNDQAQRSDDPRLGIHRARDRGDVGLDAAFDDRRIPRRGRGRAARVPPPKCRAERFDRPSWRAGPSGCPRRC